jgi:2'-hydroxyisoflavone reductase
VLILGGTKFLGPHLVEAARAEGWTVTLFNRGKTNPELFPELEKLRGDRDGDLKALEGRQWTYVIDPSGHIPRHVEATANLLAPNVERYMYVSSISAYASLAKPGVDESQPSAPMPEPYSEDVMAHYGGLKAGCERAAEAAMPGRTIVVRPGLIVGPLDPSDRFTYWPVRIERGGRVLAPGNPDDPVQFIDVRDLAAWMIAALRDGQTGLYNATGPATPTTIGALLGACREASQSDAELVWAPAEFLAEHEVAPWMQMPVWVPPSDAEFGGMGRVDIGKAVTAGLTFRPVADTIAATLAWWHELPASRRTEMRAGITAQREAEVLASLGEQSRQVGVAERVSSVELVGDPEQAAQLVVDRFG